MHFTNEFSEEALDELMDFVTKPKDYQSYEIEAPEGFNEIPVLEIAKSYSHIMEFETQERVTRLAITGKPIEIWMDGKKLDSFIMNNMNDKFDVYPPFKQHPRALIALFDICTGDMIKKSLPPRKNIDLAAAEKA